MMSQWTILWCHNDILISHGLHYYIWWSLCYSWIYSYTTTLQIKSTLQNIVFFSYSFNSFKWQTVGYKNKTTFVWYAIWPHHFGMAVNHFPYSKLCDITTQHTNSGSFVIISDSLFSFTFWAFIYMKKLNAVYLRWIAIPCVWG